MYKTIKSQCFFISLLFLLTARVIPAQEALLSDTEQYYDFLALQGLTERPYLNYRTLSDSVWVIDKETSHPWQEHKLESKYHPLGKIVLRVYGPDLFMSINTAAPYGQNDGALWQGKGINTSLTWGVRLEGYGLEVTVKPQLAFSQNLYFDIMDSSYDSKFGYFWGYAHNIGADAPQRFGDRPFFSYDWGDSEIRYSWKTLTIGFGTQAIWLGPSYLNPILHSNNAPSYPHLDIGLRRQRITIPGINWYIGDAEFRIWTGYLSESDYFDNNPDNDHTMFHGLTMAYSPSFLPGFTVAANRVCLVAWEWKNLKKIIPLFENTNEDQKMSFSVSWLFPTADLEIYGEIGIDDFTGGWIWQFIRYPFHTAVYTAGLKKELDIMPKKRIYGEIICELSWFEKSHANQAANYNFYFHHIAVHGYTNKGQWLGSGIGAGGNSQYLAFSLYYPQGNSQLFITRNNPDDEFARASDGKDGHVWYYGNLASFVIGANTTYFFNSHVLLSGGLGYNHIINPRYSPIDLTGTKGYYKTTYIYNFIFQFGIKLLF
jgi:hypothetical protein